MFVVGDGEILKHWLGFEDLRSVSSLPKLASVLYRGEGFERQGLGFRA